MTLVLRHAIMITGFVFVMMLIIEYANVLSSGTWQKRLSGHRDGTGPWWAAKGGCRTRPNYSLLAEAGMRRTLIAAAIPFLAGIVRNLTNPNGLLRGMARKLLPQSGRIEGKTAIEADFEVVDEDKKRKTI